MNLLALLRLRDFRLYWSGVIFSQIGTRAAATANLWVIFQLTGSSLEVGVLGLVEAIALFVLAPLGGAVADRLDRRRLLQTTQLLSMVVSLAVSVLVYSGRVETWHIYVAALLLGAATTFDNPARQALIPAMVPREQLVQAFALVNPSRELAILVGPAIAGVLIAGFGPGVVYAFDAATFAALAVVLPFLRIARVQSEGPPPPLWASMVEGIRFISDRPLLWQLLSLDLVAALFTSYRVLLPAIVEEVLHAGPTEFGLLASAPAAGALLGSFVIFTVPWVIAGGGRLVLAATIGYGLAAVGLGQSPTFGVALVAAGALGFFDALAHAVRAAALQLETPDAIRGRVSALAFMTQRGGPSLGYLVLGGMAAATGPAAALTLGALAPVGYALLLSVRPSAVREHHIVATSGAHAEG